MRASFITKELTKSLEDGTKKFEFLFYSIFKAPPGTLDTWRKKVHRRGRPGEIEVFGRPFAKYNDVTMIIIPESHPMFNICLVRNVINDHDKFLPSLKLFVEALAELAANQLIESP